MPFSSTLHAFMTCLFFIKKKEIIPVLIADPFFLDRVTTGV